MSDNANSPADVANFLTALGMTREAGEVADAAGLTSGPMSERVGADLAAMRSLADCCERAGAFCGEGLYAEVVRLRERERALIRAKDADLDDVRDELDETKALVGQLQGQLDAVLALAEEWRNGPDVDEWNPLADLDAALDVTP